MNNNINLFVENWLLIALILFLGAVRKAILETIDRDFIGIVSKSGYCQKKK